MEWISVMHDAKLLLPEHISGFWGGMQKSIPIRETGTIALKATSARKSRPTEADIDAALSATGGNKTKAAAQLGISIRMLYYRLASRAQKEGK